MVMVKFMNRKDFVDFIMIKVICDVNFHLSPNFDKSSILEMAKDGSVFTVVDFYKRDGIDEI